ncbi:type I polyketide synthase [Polyangium sp. 15x6]|uniref:type I polyketide synthase n=1 Tax=Polyangium sp. 15x6 TaxID=3042687 RepID=UPI00249C56F2|nr:type I polyketide synthase [Polyangium sp. 15x6]MDI3284216.1 SDR family NAD(P)-dependent oxidoreductase [Polyangium sp. 15x6]
MDPQRVLAALRNAKSRIAELEARAHEPIAVVGIGCRFPGGRTPATFWATMATGADMIREVPESRLLGPWPEGVPRWAGLLDDEPDRFDAAFFGISPREAQSLDPQQRLLLEVSWEALEDAGFVPERLHGSRTGVFVGLCFTDYRQRLRLRPFEERDAGDFTGNLASTAAGRLSYVLGLRGPAVTVDTACSSSLVSVHLACQSLRDGEVDLALAGGVNLILSERTTAAVALLQALSPEGRCKTFDASANGFVRGEGAGIVVLKRLSDAQRDGDTILALVRGSAVNQDGRSTGLTAPNVLAQEALLGDALRNARVEPHEVGFIECHGTGTSLGDPIETEAIRSVFGAQRKDGSRLWLGALKTNIGHLEAAAGIAGFIKVVLALGHRRLPPNLHLRHLNPRVRIAGTPLSPVSESIPWSPVGNRRLGGVSSFGLSGTNAHVILEEAPARPDQGRAIEPARLPFLVSGRSVAALQAQAARLREHLAAQPESSLSDVAYSLAMRRTYFEHRAVVIAGDRRSLDDGLSALARDERSPGVVTDQRRRAGKLALLFTGQGSQYPGMGRDLYEAYPVYREAFDAVCARFDGLLDEPLRDLVLAKDALGDRGALQRTQYTQPALFALEVSLYRLLASWGVKPDVLGGHSIGEIVAAHVAGVFSLDDACALVAARARLMGALPEGGAMVALQATEQEVLSWLAAHRGRVDVAAQNGPEATVIAGDEDAVLAVEALARAMGRKTTRLSVSHAFHSPRMDEMLEAFRRAVRGLEFRAPQIPLVSNVTGRRATADELCSADYWVAHARRAVRWHDGMRSLVAEGVGTYLELGPQGVLSGLGPACLSEEEESAAAFFSALRKNADGVQTLLSALAGLFARGVDVDWAAFFAPLSARPVALPTYAFQRERYWLEGGKPQDTTRGSTHSLDEAGFWEAVERGDFGRVSAVLGVGDDGERSALGTAVSVLSRWRRKLRERSAIDSLRYQIEWKPLEVPEVRASGGTCWLVLGERERACPVETSLREALEEQGVRVESVVLSDADADRERIAASLRVGASGAAPPRAVFSLLSLDERPAFGEAALPLGAIRALALAQALGDIALEAPLFLVTSGAVSIGRSDRLAHPVQALSWGLGRVFALEHPERWGGLVDIAGTLDAPGRARLVAALFGSGGEDQIAARPGATYACRLRRAPREDEAERPAFRPRGTVLITGGTGAIGGEIGRWLARLGAEHIVLTSRRGAETPGARELGAELEALGAKVTLVACDVAERAEVDALVRRLDAGQTPIRAVFHAAGVTHDTPFAETNAEELRQIVAGKAAGAWHLHEALSATPLDAFVVFSSVAGVLGNGHQCAYAAANAFLDALVEHRVASGLPGLSIAWGMWGGAGMAADASVQEHLRRRGFRAMAPADALRALQRALEHGESTGVVADIDWARFAPWFAAARARSLLADMPEASTAMARSSTSPANASGASDLLLELRSVGERERKERLVALVLKETAIVLGHKSVERLDPMSGFMDLGLDSLMAVGLRQRLRRATGVSLPATLAFDHPTPDHVARFLLDQLSHALGESRPALVGVPELRATPRADDEPIAIVGVGLDLPGGCADLSSLFEVLSRAEDTIGSVPTDRWSLEGFYDPDPDAIGKSYVKEAAFVDRVDRFDAAFFGVSPREAKSLDPQHRLLLEATWRALEDAGVKPFDLKNSRTGVFVGMGPSEYERLQDGVRSADAHALLGTHASFAAGRIAFILGLQGPALSVDTACSSSLVALHLACRALRHGECDVALAAGVQVIAAPEPFVLLSRTRALAPDGRSKPFSANANGYGRGEGVVVLALERLSDARKHGRTILAVVRGSAVNHDGASSALTAPNGTSQQKVLRAALEDAGLSPADIDVVECHGTGTSLGDPIEVQAISAVYGQGRPKERPLLLGAVKSNIGHLESAAGLAGVAKVLAALRHEALPPTLHTTPRNPHIEWDALPVRVTDALTPWPRRSEGGPRRASVSAFGLSGTNAHVILEEPPAEDAPARASVTAPASLPFLISGASVEALRAQAARLGEHLATRQDEELLDVAHSLANSRTHFVYRAAVVAEDRGALVGTLGALARGERPAGITFGDNRKTGKLAVLFTGQGSQHPGMGKLLHEAYPVFRDAFDACAAFFDRGLDRPLREVLFAPEGSADAALLDRTAYAQPALFAVEVALYRLVSSCGVRPDVLSGHSIGELAAAHVAGVFSLEDACTIVAARGRLMQELPAGGAMVALQASEAEVVPWLEGDGGRVDIAALNGPTSTVIAGDEGAVMAVAGRAAALGRKTTRLVVSHAFHSPRIVPMLDAFRRVLQGVRANRPSIPIVSNVTGKLATDEELCNPEYWVRHVRQVVRWLDGMRLLEAAGVTSFLELGPRGTLSGLGPDCLLDGEHAAFFPALRRDTPETRTLAAALGGIFARGNPVDWQAFFAPHAPRRVALPTYAFQHERYWLPAPSRALASGVGERPAVEARFWNAVESEDAEDVQALLGVDEATQRASIAAALPSLRRWRRTQAETEAALALRYHVTWRPLPDSGPSETRGTWLVVVGDEDARSSLAEAVEHALREHGGEVVRVVLGDGDVDRRTLGARITEAVSRGVALAGVVSLASLDEAPLDGQATIPRGFVRTLALAQALLDVSVQAPLWIVTSGAVRVGRSDRCERPLGALSWGLGRVFGLEHPERWGGLVDVVGPLDARGRARLAGAFVSQNGETEIALRSSGRYVRRITRASREDDANRPSYEPRGTILITGGTGALGAEVARWLAKRGATHIVLTSRRGGEAPGAAELSAELGALGARVTVAACDVANRASVAKLVEGLDAAGSPIRAVFHAAGVVQLSPFSSVEPADLASVISGKAAGAWHLHELLSHRPLDAFVVFSSIAGVWGSAHQAVYAAANAFLDALMEHRRQRGLAGTSIAWGMWDGGGMASDEAARSFMERRGVRPLAPPLALLCLDRALRSEDATVTVADIDWPVFAPLLAAARTRAWLDDLPDARAALATEPARGDASDESSALCAALRPLPTDERVEHLVRLVLAETAAVLGHADAEGLDARAGFMDLGVDSLMAVELRRRLRLVTGLPLPVTLTFDHPSPRHVAVFLLDGLAALLGRTTPVTVDATAETASTASDEPIAVVGIGLRLPGGGVDLSTFFRFLAAGNDAVVEIPADRWDVTAFYDPNPEQSGKSYVREAALLDRVDQFDASFFGISPREAKNIDPQHRLLLEASWQALEDAGRRPGDLKDSKTGVFVGIGAGDYGLLQAGASDAEAYTVLGTHASFAAGRVAFTLGLQGPALSVDTACSSSLVALHLACRALRNGECDTALAAGVQVIAAPEPFVLLSRTRALAPDGRSKTFSAAADGYGRGEGVVVLALERLADARRHGRNILAVLRGSAVNHDGASSGITAPNGTSQQKVLRAALDDARLAPTDVDVVECHGTGTSLGDPIEVQALSAVYGAGRPKVAPLLLGAVKTNVGHLESAAGITGVVKMIAALRYGALPPTLHTTPRNPHIDWESLPVRVVDTITPWPRRADGRPRRAAVSAFGLSGTNAHVILEEYPAEELPVAPASPKAPQPLPFLLSGKTPGALLEQAARLREHVEAHPELALADVAHSLANSRTHFEHRAVIVADQPSALVESLGALARAERPAGVMFGEHRKPRKLVFLFTGQGSQHPRMGKQLAEVHPVFRDALEACCAHFDTSLDRPLLDVMFAPEGSADAALLDQTLYTQPALFAIEVALHALVTSWGLRPDVLFGHSIGEIVAAHVASVMTLGDACTLVAARARLMQELPPGGAMVSLQASEAEVLPWIAEHPGRVDIASLNGPLATVVAGDEDAVLAVAAKVTALGRKATRLAVSHAFHSPRIAPMLDAFRRVVEGIRLAPPNLPIISDVTGKRATEEELTSPEYWVRHVRHAVRWLDGMRTLEAEGVSSFLELGPRGVLCGLGPDCLSDGAGVRATFVPALRKDNAETRSLVAALAGLFAHGHAVDWEAFFAPISRRRVTLPTYAFQRERHWIDRPRGGLTSLGSAAGRYPLSGTRVDLPDGSVLHTVDVGPGVQPYLADHVVYGRIVIAGAFYLTILLAIAEAHYPDQAIELRQVHFARVLAFAHASEHATLHVQLTRLGGGAPGFSVVVCTRKDDEWTTHVTAVLAPVAPSAVSPRANLSPPPADATPDEVSRLDTMLRAAGVEFGARWWWLQKLHTTRDRVGLGRFEAPDGIPSDDAPLPGGLVDNGFAFAQWIGTRSAGEVAQGRSVTRLPFAVDRFVWYGRRVVPAWVEHAILTENPVEAEVCRADLTFWDAEGKPVAHIDGFTNRRAPEERLLAGATNRDLFVVSWVEPPTPAQPPRQAPASIALLGEACIAEQARLSRAFDHVSRYADLDSLGAALDQGGDVPRVLLLCAETRPDAGGDVAGEAHAATHRAVAWLQTILADARLSTHALVILTKRAVATRPDEDVLDLAHAPLWGLVRTARIEHPDRELVVVDIDESEPSLLALPAALSTGEVEFVLRDGTVRVPRLARASVPRDLESITFPPGGTVLVTGGTGALGAEVARHLVEKRGVDRLLLVSQRGPEAAGADALLEALRAAGAVVTIVACDVSDRDALKALLDGMPDEHPLTAVIHTAGVLDDGVLLSLTPERTSRVLRPKVDAALALHELTLGLDLSAFVVFSSLTGLLGNAGQASYAAANAFLDALAARRRASGRKAVSLAYGPWAEGGMAARLSVADRERMRKRGFSLLSREEGLALFDAALDWDAPLVVGAHIEVSTSGAQADAVPEMLKGLVRTAPRRHAASETSAAPTAIKQRLVSLPEPERERVLVELVRKEAAAVLGAKSQAVDPERPLQDLGLDSLMAIELRNRLGAETGLRLPATLLFDHPTPTALAKLLRSEILGEEEAVAPVVAPSTAGTTIENEPIAIIGIGCRYPGGVESPEDLWRLVREGVDAIGPFPSDRGWDVDAVYDPDPEARGKIYVREGGFLTRPDLFDPGFFGLSPREAIYLDPQQRLFLETSQEAIERAGIDPTALNESPTGVFVGVCYNDYELIVPGPREAEDAYPAMGTSTAIASGRIAYTFGLQGPTVTVDTACSSSLVAIHLACQALRNGECSLALAGGATVFATPEPLLVFARMKALSPDGRCRAFSADANGAGWGEGAGMLLLERLSDALRNNHPILALVRGSALNQDGRSQGLTAPNGPSQRRVIRQALAAAKLSPGDIDAIEAHGTGTPLGDPIEAEALLGVYGRSHSSEAPLWLGTLKSNIGHTQAAAGVGGVIKMILALQHELLPRTLHTDPPSQHIDWSSGALRVLADAVSWTRNGRPRRAGVSSFGVSGTNAHVIIEEAPFGYETAPLPATAPSRSFLLPLSGKTERALRTQAERLAGHLASHPELDLADVAFSLATTRAHLEHRAVIVATERESAREALAALATGRPDRRIVQGRVRGSGRVVFVFPGQGSQWAGMAVPLLDASDVFRASIEACERALAPHVDWSLEQVLRGEAGAPSMDRMDVLQPVLFAVMVSLAALWRSLGIEPDAVIGHSQGEIAAAYVAGGLSLEDAARVAALRSRALLKVAGRGAMASVELSASALGGRLARHGELVEVAAINGPSSTVVSGETAAIDALLAELTNDGVFARKVRVDFASHCAQMDSLREELLDALAPVSSRRPIIPFQSTVDLGAPPEGLFDAAYWFRNLRSTVRFAEATRCLLETGHRVFIEVSPHPVLNLALQASLDAAEEVGVVIGTLQREEGGFDRVLSAFAELHAQGVLVNWARVLPPARKVPLPTYAFQRERYWSSARAARGEAGGPAAAAKPIDREFWAAVERADVETLAGSLGLVGDSQRASLAAVLPALSSFHEKSREREALDTCRYRIAWRPWTPASNARLQGRWLLVVPPGVEMAPLEVAVERALVDGGAEVIVVRLTDDAMDVASLATTLSNAMGQGASPGGVVALVPYEGAPREAAPALPRCAASAFTLLRAFVEANLGARLWLVTSGAVSTGPNDPLKAPEQALVWGLGRAVSMEHPSRWGGQIDVAGGLDGSALARLVSMLGHGGDEDQFALRSDGIRVRRLVRAPLGNVAATRAFEPSGAVLVTGGTGALGSELSRWLVERGARHLVLTSRRGGDAPGAASLAAELEGLGARVTMAACDVQDRSALSALVERLESEGTPIRSVFHAAGVSHQRPLVETNLDTFADVVSGKAIGALRVHEVFAGRPLDVFVMFASIAGVWGSANQGGYAAANAFLDALAEHRRGLGLAGTSIAWGLWEGGGMGSDEAAQDRLRRLGIGALPIGRALEAMLKAIEHDEVNVTVADVSWARFVPSFTAARPRPLLAELPEAQTALEAPVEDRREAGAEAELLAELRPLTERERIERLVALVLEVTGSVLGHADGGAIDARAGFTNLGLDSLMALELRRRLERATGVKLPATLAFDHPTPHRAATFLAQALQPALHEEGKEGSSVIASDVSDQEIRRLLGRVSIPMLRKKGILDALLSLAEPGPADEAPKVAVTDLDAFDDDALIAAASSILEEK